MQKMEFTQGYQLDKVMVDFSAYTGRDQYSDGDIENELLEIVRSGNVQVALRCDKRWPILYHLSPERENLLNWLPFSPEASLLEIGMGCGGVTGVFCNKVKSVEAVEISARRAEISAYRHHDCSNLSIHVGNLNDMQFDEKFDYVTLIGVLEYAGQFTHDNDPFSAFLRRCKSYLKPQGKLIVAIENRLGLKYWAGAREDHTGKIFDGLEGYSPKVGVRTFSRKELGDLLARSGFNSVEWYYPFPDYKLPCRIFSDKYLPEKDNFFEGQIPYYDRDRYVLFSEKKVFNGIIDSGLFAEFSNSFLVICSEV